MHQSAGPRASIVRGFLRGLLVFLAIRAGESCAADLIVPLRIPYALMGIQLDAGGMAVPVAPTVYEAGACRTLRVEASRFELREGKLHSLSRVSAQGGVLVLGRCVSPIRWSGTADLQVDPVLGKDWRLGLAVTDSMLYREDGTPAPLAGLMLDMVALHLKPQIERYSIDLAAPRAEIMALLGEGSPPAYVVELGSVLDSLRLLAPRAENDGVALDLALMLPDRWLTAESPPSAEAPLSEAELARRREVLDTLDAFVLFAVKRAGLDLADSAIRVRLLDLLIDTRYRLLDVLAGEGESARSSQDPVRVLLPEVWAELRAIVADARDRGLLRGRLLGYTLFLDAGDVLLALDGRAPATGGWISANGLRRLARMLQPGQAADPLEYGEAVDPLLREIFGLGAEPPSLPRIPGADRGGEGPGPPLSPAAPLRGSWLDWLIPVARAADDTAGGRMLLIGQQLDRWAPPKARLPEYADLVSELLTLSADRALRQAELADEHAEAYRALVPATAMIESCWRQFVREGKEVTYVHSQTGSLGLMQVNPKVWRRLYDADKLKWDIAYNAGAGTQILMLYLKDHGVPLVDKTGEADHLAQAAYAAYNAGPAAARRFLKAKPASQAKQIDKRLLKLYRGFAAGGAADLDRCTVAEPAQG